MKTLLTIICALSYLVTTWAQRISVTELPTQEQLPVSHIHRVLQDTEGYMWYATEGGGLCRDNGYQIDVFRADRPGSTLASNVITCMAEDRGGHVWFCTERGVYFIDKHDYKIHRIEDKRLKDAAAYSIAALSDGTVLVGLRTSVIRLSSDGKALREYILPHPAHDINALYEDKDGTVWALMSSNAMLRLRRGDREFKPAAWDYGHAPSQMTETSTKGTYWVGTWGGGVVRYTLTEGKGGHSLIIPQQATKLPADDKHKQQILSLLQDSGQGLLWVVTMEDLYAYADRGGELAEVAIPETASRHKKILDLLMEDKQGRIWVPGYSPHTFIISYGGEDITRYDVNTPETATGYPLLGDAVVQDGDGFWIWQGRDGLSIFRPESNSIRFTKDMGGELGKLWFGKQIQKCAGQDGIWAFTGNRLYRLRHDGTSAAHELCQTLGECEKIRCVSDLGAKILIGTSEGLYERTALGGKLRKLLSDKNVTLCAADTRGNIYEATADKKVRMTRQGKAWTDICDGEDFTAMAASAAGTLWLGSAQGNIYSYTPGSGKPVRENERCNHNGDAVKDMEVDGLGHVWILTDKTLKEFNPSNNSFRVLRCSDSQIGMDYYHSLWKAGNESICVGGIGAFCIVKSSEELDRQPSPIKVHVSSVTLDGTKELPGMGVSEIDVPADKVNLEVAFSTLDVVHAHDINYAYRLAGFSDKWVYLPPGVNIAYFSMLPHGDYTLEVKATDRFGCWGEAQEVLRIHRSMDKGVAGIWLICLSCLAVCLCLALATRFVQKRYRHMRKMQEERKALALTEVSLNEDELRSTKADSEFLSKAIRLAEENLGDSAYSIEQMSADMCMSRMSLYRKIQDVTGMSPTEFMRDIRLKKAAMLLKSSDATIAEVAAKVGFSNQSYFCKCFKEKFGDTPSKFSENEKQRP